MLKLTLPEIYQNFLPAEFLSLEPQEKLADCQNCYKTKPTAPKPHFDSQLKCCTYYPHLPNYLIGGVLSDPSYTIAQTVIREMIHNRTYITPLGLTAPPAYQNMFNLKSATDFGNDWNLKCPFFQVKNGHCSVWEYRGHECATYFCHSSYEKGEQFWQGVRDVLHELEMFLSQMVLAELGFQNHIVDACLELVKKSEYKIDEGWQLPSVEFSRLWGDEVLNIEDFYKRTFQYIKENSGRLKGEWLEHMEQSGAIDVTALENFL